jgi:hypothetical protein
MEIQHSCHIFYRASTHPFSRILLTRMFEESQFKVIFEQKVGFRLDDYLFSTFTNFNIGNLVSNVLELRRLRTHFDLRAWTEMKILFHEVFLQKLFDSGG